MGVQVNMLIVAFIMAFVALWVVYVSFQLSEISHCLDDMGDDVKTVRRVLVHEMEEEEIFMD